MADAKIVILTISAEDHDIFVAVRSGACGYLVKSMDADELITALEQAHQGIPPFSPGLAARLIDEFARLAGADGQAAPSAAGPRPAAGLLTGRQCEVLSLVARGLSYKEVGVQLNLSPRTIKYHMSEIMSRLHLEHRAQVLAYAGRMGLGNDASE